MKKLLRWLRRNAFKIAVLILLLFLLLTALVIVGTLTESQNQETQTEATYRYYINKDGANTRACPSTDCKIIGTQKLNDFYDFTFKSLMDMPEWLYIKTFIIGSEEEGLIEAYIHRSNFSASPVTPEQKPQTIVRTQTIQRDSQISSADLKPYLTGVVDISCYGDPSISGSGSVWNIPGKGQGILTNAHVTIRNMTTGKDCRIWSGNGGFLVEVDYESSYYWNKETDAIAHKLSPDTENIPESSLSSLNYSISKMKWCPKDTPVGTPLVIIGFPSYATKVEDYGDGMVGTASYQTTSNGIVSGHDTEPTFKDLPTANYFISAKIDSGNSGGVALAKIDNEMCLLGIPTWLTVGNYETQGLVQNIHNIFYKPN